MRKLHKVHNYNTSYTCIDFMTTFLIPTNLSITSPSGNIDIENKSLFTVYT